MKSKGDSQNGWILLGAGIIISALVTAVGAARSLRNIQREGDEEGEKEAAAAHISPDARILVATRIHGQEASNRAFDPAPLRRFIQNALNYAHGIAIAVEIGNVFHPRLLVSVQDVVNEFTGKVIHIIPVAPWGRFVPALNATLSFAAQENHQYILFQSLEIEIMPETFVQLRNYFDPERDLVVGAALHGHDFKAGKQELTGCASPWNTLALWSVAKLGLTGFLLVSDGLLEKASAGIEEVAVISLAQHIRRWSRKGGAIAKLVKLDVSWDVEWNDPARKQWHEKKMQGKISRARTQLEALNLPSAHVLHIKATPPNE